MRMVRIFELGLVTKEDIKKINTRFIKNDNVSLLPMKKLRCACYTNDERNAYTNNTFMQHLKGTYTKANNDTNADDNTIHSPYHECKIKSGMSHQNNLEPLNRTYYNRILDECIDAKNSHNFFVEHTLKLFHNIPLMTLNNNRTTEGLANGTTCRGLHLKFKDGCYLEKEK